MAARLHIVGCVNASKPSAKLIGQILTRARKSGAEVLTQSDREAIFLQFEAADANLIAIACDAIKMMQPSVIRFGFASGVKEIGKDGKPRLGERGIMQACDLAGAAGNGEVLVSSQLGSLIEVGQTQFAAQLLPTFATFSDGRRAAAYAVLIDDHLAGARR